MDPATAKTLVSATLVAAIALFSLASFEALIRQMVQDVRAARVPARAAARPRPGAPRD